MREKLNILRGKKSDLSSGTAGKPDGEITRIKRTIRRQAILTVLTLAVVGVVLFAMTSAWFTNVSKISTISFKTQTWGFDTSNITVGGAGGISAAPGAGGIVPLDIDNSSGSDRLSARVTVSKNDMGEEFRKRIYFYADTPRTAGGEISVRTWIGATNADSFRYRIDPGGHLVVSDSTATDVPVKWMWVYDVVGYYFRGSLTDGGIRIDEYIRPIEYDPDEAVFDGDNGEGALVSVGGVPIGADGGLLKTLFASDGYENGTNVPRRFVLNGKTYYAVSVNQDGTGVFAYLLTGAEVRSAIDFDTVLSPGLTVSATVSVTVDSVPVNTEEVDDPAGLAAALADDSISVVKLAGDIAVASPVAVSGGEKTLDLGGNELRFGAGSDSYSMFSVSGGGSLTLTNGDVTGNGNLGAGEGSSAVRAVTCVSGDVTLKNVKIRDFDNAVYVRDTDGAGDSVIRIVGCDIVTASQSVFIMGNGAATESDTKLIIDNTTIDSGYVAMIGQGSENLWGTDISISNSTLTGKYAAIYQPQQKAKTLVVRSTLSGYTGVAVKGGKLTLRDCTVTGTGAYAPAAASGSGWTDTGDGVYVEAVYPWSASVTVEGASTVNSTYGYAAELFGKDGAGPGSVTVNSGSFAGAQGAAGFNGIGSFVIHGGTFTGTVADGVTRTDTP